MIFILGYLQLMVDFFLSRLTDGLLSNEMKQVSYRCFKQIIVIRPFLDLIAWVDWFYFRSYPFVWAGSCRTTILAYQLAPNIKKQVS